MGFLQVLLLIMKILGILFLSVIALLLVSVVLLLFVPLRYRLQGHKAEDYSVEARLTWLLRLIRVKIQYAADTKLFYEVRLLWFILLSSDEVWKTAEEEKKKIKAEKKKQKQKEKRAKKAKKKKRNGHPAQNKNQNISKKVTTVPTELSEAKSEPSEPEVLLQEEKKEELNWFLRIVGKIKLLFGKLKDKLGSIWNQIKNLWKKADKIISFLKDETNKAAFGASWTSLIRLLKHVGPTRIRGYLAFGTDDPAATGYILAVLGIFYGKFGKSFSIRPNFEEKQLETEIRAKGRIRMSRILHLALKLWRDKNFKTLLDNMKQLKE